jgi:ATP-binding cassette subfamily C protein CydCD
MVGVAEAGAVAASTRAAAARLDELTSRAPVVVDSSEPHPLPDVHSVEVRRASVDRVGSTAPLNADLHLSPGDRVAVVGPTGSGKSTLAALLLRFIDPSSGDVRLGGQPLPELVLADVRRTVGLVDDDPHIFASTLYENVRLARSDAEPDDVLRAVRDAHLGSWLESLPDGMNSWLGDGHAGVSGGERARIAIARSLLADQPVLVLDEPTAHLDRTTAESLALEVLVGADHRSVVWITHTEIGLQHVDSVITLSSS